MFWLFLLFRLFIEFRLLLRLFEIFEVNFFFDYTNMIPRPCTSTVITKFTFTFTCHMATTLVSLNQPLAVGTFLEVVFLFEEHFFHILTSTFMFWEHAFQTIDCLALPTLSLPFSAVLLQCPFFTMFIWTKHPIVLLCEFPELDLSVFLLLRLS